MDKVPTKWIESFLIPFSKKNGIAFDTISSISAMMSRTDFPDGAKILLRCSTHGFAQFENIVKSSNDKITRASGYSAMSTAFQLKLYEAYVSKVFIQVYYGDFSTTITSQVLILSFK